MKVNIRKNKLKNSTKCSIQNCRKEVLMNKLLGKERSSNEVVVRSGEESGRIRSGDKLV